MLSVGGQPTGSGAPHMRALFNSLNPRTVSDPEQQRGTPQVQPYTEGYTMTIDRNKGDGSNPHSFYHIGFKCRNKCELYIPFTVRVTISGLEQGATPQSHANEADVDGCGL